MVEGLRRHDLVHVDPAAWRIMLVGRPELQAVDLVAEWASVGRPLVVRRRNAGDPDGQVALGLPLPPASGKQRVAVSLDPAAILTSRRFPTLRAAGTAAPADWHGMTEALLGLATQVRVEPLVFGSLAWSVLTGIDYLGPTSDLDLLWPMNGGEDAFALLDGLARIAAKAPVRLDGEILDGDGRGVDWRELAFGHSEVLVKELTSVALISPGDFLQAKASA